MPALLVTTHIVSGVVIEKDGKYLLVQERQPKARCMWNLPAGRVDEGDTLEQTAIREAKEETGYDVKLGKHLQVIHEAVERPVSMPLRPQLRVVSSSLRNTR